jgi:MerR family regulatory protein.
MSIQQLSLFDTPPQPPNQVASISEHIQIEQLQKVYYTTSEVAAMFRVNTSLLRFWEKEFPKQLGHVKKNKKGDRFYNKKNIEQLKVIYYLIKEKKMTLAGARDILKLKKSNLLDQKKELETLKNLRQFLINIRTSIRT